MLWSLSPIHPTKIEGAEAPVLQLSNKVLGTNALSQVEFTLPVEAEDVLEDPRWPVEVELSTDQAEGVTEGEDLRYRGRGVCKYNVVLRCLDLIIKYLTLRCCISQPLKSAIRKFINGVPFYLMNRSAHIQDHYALIEAGLIWAWIWRIYFKVKTEYIWTN